MTRITKDIRDAIVAALIKNRFEDRVKDLIAARSNLARGVYEDKYSKAMRDKMAALPTGWLPEVESLNVYFGTSYSSVYITGKLYGNLCNVVKVENSEALRIPNKDKGGCLVKYEGSHRLTLEHDRVVGLNKDLEHDIDAAKKAAETAISRVATIKRLIEAWPEIEPFARKFNVEKPQLPAIRTGELNAMLGLPVDGDPSE